MSTMQRFCGEDCDVPKSSDLAREKMSVPTPNSMDKPSQASDTTFVVQDVFAPYILCLSEMASQPPLWMALCEPRAYYG